MLNESMGHRMFQLEGTLVISKPITLIKNILKVFCPETNMTFILEKLENREETRNHL